MKNKSKNKKHNITNQCLVKLETVLNLNLSSLNLPEHSSLTENLIKKAISDTLIAALAEITADDLKPIIFKIEILQKNSKSFPLEKEKTN